MVVMGINRLPEIRDYWSTDDKLRNTFIASKTRDRFEQISRYLHFVDNTRLPSQNEPGYHCLQKVLPIITHMKRKCKENYSPHPQNSVDEAMIGYKGKKHNLFTNTHIHAHRSVLHDSVHAHEAYEEGIPDGNNMLGAG